MFNFNNKYLSFLIFTFLLSLNSKVFSQTTWNSPKEALEWLNGKIAEIKLVDRTIKQNLVSDLEKGSKCELFYSVEYDGTVTFTKLSLFYWENINVDAIEATVKGKELFLSISANDGSKFIKEKKSGDDAYLFTNKIQLYFDDIQTARNAIECFKFLKKESPPFQPIFNTKLDAYTYLKNEIGKIVINTNEYDQSLTVQTDQNDKFLVNIKETDSRGVSTTKRYEFYMTDFNGKSVSVKTYPAKLSIELISSSEIKPVKYFINDIQQNYTNKIELHADDVQKAYILKNTFIYLTGEKTEDLVKSEKKSAAEALFPHHFKENKLNEPTKSNAPSENNPIKSSIDPFTLLKDENIQNPDYDLVPLWYDFTNKTLQPLERKRYSTEARVSGMVSSESLLFFENISSTVVFAAGSTPLFVIRLSSTTVDPYTVIELSKATINKKLNRREFIIYKNGTYKNTSDVETINLIILKKEPGVYYLKPENPLPAGEYFFGQESGQQVHAFSVK